MLPATSLLTLCIALIPPASLRAEGLKTWDGKHSIDRIEVTVVYFVPRDRTPLADWKDRVGYYCRRLERFHQREFGGQSTLTMNPLAEPFRSARTTEQLRDGDADFIFFQTLREVDADLEFGKGEHKAFPILLVLSEINWRPLDDFYRVRPKPRTKDSKPGEEFEFEGSYSNCRHFPGAASGGARATYLADRGVGWGLVSGDGWRVPLSGSDCVVYHEGVGHTIGVPHPEPANNTVMSQGQYHGWISESSVDETQKKRLKWSPPETTFDRSHDLFSTFRALPEPAVPKPGQPVALKLDWPANAKLTRVRVRIQTALDGPWIDIPVPAAADRSESIPLGPFDRPTPVSYRVDATIEGDDTVELWGYFQVRSDDRSPPLPSATAFGDRRSESLEAAASDPDREEIDLLALIDVEKDGVAGKWTLTDGVLQSPKEFGARIEIPYQPPEEYRLTVIAEPLDEPNALNLGQRSGDRRFLALLNYTAGKTPSNALENIDGKNVGNVSTSERKVFAKGRPSQILCTVRKDSVAVSIDGREIIQWKGDRSRLSLSDYWKTPHDNALFVGAYDCRYRITRITLQPLSGDGKRLRD
ncbi:MAG: hypothetical protein IT428_14520 [Planctomycetaceae bacterium]|nr:hypothetical protein [Planctomycetaceae bacterium]